MATSSTNQPEIIASSAASFHSSGSHHSISQGSRHGTSSPSNHLTTRTGTRIISNPGEYTLPGAAPDTYTIYAVAGARIYHSTQLTGNHTGTLGFGWGHGSGSSKDKSSGSQWSFSHLKGTLIFGRDKQSATVSQPPTGAAAAPAVAQGQGEDPNAEWWFQLVDDNTGKMVWKFKIPLSPGTTKFNYDLDRPFFHVFQGSSRKYGFLFDDDKEAGTFSTEVVSRTAAALAANPKPSKMRSRSLSIRAKKSKSKEASSSSSQSPATSSAHHGISTSMISSPAPNSFRHMNHIGINATSGALETSKNLDPSFREILSDLHLQSGANVTESIVLEHLDFVQGFWQDIDSLQRSTNSRPVAAN